MQGLGAEFNLPTNPEENDFHFRIAVQTHTSCGRASFSRYSSFAICLNPDLFAGQHPALGSSPRNLWVLYVVHDLFVAVTLTTIHKSFFCAPLPHSRKGDFSHFSSRSEHEHVLSADQTLQWVGLASSSLRDCHSSPCFGTHSFQKQQLGPI